MISQMDQIYSSAYLTIVAAAGLNAHTGLPGVSGFHRRQLQDAYVGDVHFVQLPRPGLSNIMFSHWASRGWTFQECCLAGRRLIFTEDQTLFLCNKSFVSESVKPRIIRDRWSYFHFAHLIRRPTMQGDTSKHLLEQVREYSRRDISYDSDSLNAFLGVLHQWEIRLAKTKKPMSHLWGLPIRGAITRDPGSIDFYFLWSHTFHDFFRRPVRRHDFPSWSWAGWAGTKSFDEAPIHLAEIVQEQNQFDIHISVQSDDQRTQTLADFHKDAVAGTRKSQHHRPGPTRLLVTCAVFPLKFQRFELSQIQEHTTTEMRLRVMTWLTSRPQNDKLILFHIFENMQVGISGDLEQTIKPNDRLSGLLLHQSKTGDLFLVVREVGEALYERVGLIRWLPEEDILLLNTEGFLLDQVKLSDRNLFPSEFERRTMCLV